MKNRIKIVCTLVLGLLLGLNGPSKGQSTQDSALFKPFGAGMYPKKNKKGLRNISIGGSFRFMGTYTAMKEQYPEFGPVSRRLFLGDDSNLPMLDMTFSVTPFKNTSFSGDLYIWTPLSGNYDDFVRSMLLGVRLSGTHSTKFGTFTVRAGGIHWCRLSPFTFGANTGYNRYSLFERNPWDPNTKDLFDRYESYFDLGAINQDVRWGMQAFHGITLDATNLPHDFSFSLMYGKSVLNGGTLPLPNSMIAGRVKKQINKHFVSLNMIRSVTFSDSLARESLGFNLISTESEFNWKDKILVRGEIGAGNYFSPQSQSRWGEAFDVMIRFSEKLTFFPIEIRYYQISPNVINNNGSFWNSSIEEFDPSKVNVQNTAGQSPLLIPFASSMVGIGQMTNNRRGLILSTDLKYKKQKLTIGYSVAGEMKGLSNKITYGHPANNLALSRFWRWDFPAEVGPYGNINKIYRGVYETVNLRDSIPVAKGFNTLEISYKTSFKLFKRKFALFYLGSFHSVQDKWSPFPKYSRKAFLQSYNHQLEFYYQLFPKVVLSNYLGYDRIVANDSTQLDIISLKPKDQIGLSYAFGFDFQLSKNVALYFRQRWMFYRDRSFADDKYRGSETSLELKMYF